MQFVQWDGRWNDLMDEESSDASVDDNMGTVPQQTEWHLSDNSDTDNEGGDQISAS